MCLEEQRKERKKKITSLNVFFLTPLGDFFSSIKTGINF